MNNETSTNLNIVLGQLEDELRSIKSAQKQADGVVSASNELCTKLERVIAETRQLVEESNIQTREATELLTNEVNRMSTHSEAINKAAADGAEAITKRASDAQASLERISNDIIEKTSDQMTKFTEQETVRLNKGIKEAKVKLDAIAESAKAAASDVKASGDTLIEANETCRSEIKRQNEQTRALLEDAQKHLGDIDMTIASLKKIDIESLVEEVKDLKVVEANNVASLKSRLQTTIGVVGVSIVLCIAILAKLFVG